MDLLVSLSGWIRPYNHDIALALVATLLVVFGDTINGMVRRAVRKHWMVVRVAVFIALCTFGYGAITVWVVPLLASLLMSVSAQYYGVSVVVAFTALGLMAERFHRKS
ncbi:DUF3392 domain-containing protein [Oceanobacter kriegii]|uniref:DUF3392 domain-containing protein n=1 Tax=Oceanobacter kriegii TaxID=64972 RepID=UPI000481325D|nr:DUF3392 domain-containing protein [Oceanobacter kriegii]